DGEAGGHGDRCDDDPGGLVPGAHAGLVPLDGWVSHGDPGDASTSSADAPPATPSPAEVVDPAVVLVQLVTRLDERVTCPRLIVDVETQVLRDGFEQPGLFPVVRAEVRPRLVNAHTLDVLGITDPVVG